MEGHCSNCLEWKDLPYFVDFFESVKSLECLGTIGFCSKNCVKTKKYEDDVLYCLHYNGTFMQFATHEEFLRYLRCKF